MPDLSKLTMCEDEFNDKESRHQPSVSFRIPTNEPGLSHRNSISTKSAKEIQNDDNIIDEAKEKLCNVHMPGDFVYLSEKKLDVDKKSVSSTTVFHKTPRTNEPQGRFPEFFKNQDDNKFHVLMACTGSVATIKVPLIIDRLFRIYSKDYIAVHLIVTKPAEHFLDGLRISKDVKVWREEDVMADYEIGELLLFHELRRWADIFVIAPLSANTLAKLANGICDSLVTSVARDWTGPTPIIVAPAMNTFMYMNPMTKKHLTILRDFFPYYEILKPVEKVLICGDIGMGGMREWSSIVDILRTRIREIYLAKKLQVHEEAHSDVEDSNDETTDDETVNSRTEDDTDDDNESIDADSMV